MLSVMMYDAWIFISALIGGGLGYFIFGQMFMKINLENCQILRDAYCTQICGETGRWLDKICVEEHDIFPKLFKTSIKNKIIF